MRQAAAALPLSSGPDATLSAHPPPLPAHHQGWLRQPPHSHADIAQALATGTGLAHGKAAPAWPGQCPGHPTGPPNPLAPRAPGAALRSGSCARGAAVHQWSGRRVGAQCHAAARRQRPLARHQGPGHAPAGRTAVRAPPGAARSIVLTGAHAPLARTRTPGTSVGTAGPHARHPCPTLGSALGVLAPRAPPAGARKFFALGKPPGRRPTPPLKL